MATRRKNKIVSKLGKLNMERWFPYQALLDNKEFLSYLDFQPRAKRAQILGHLRERIERETGSRGLAHRWDKEFRRRYPDIYPAPRTYAPPFTQFERERGQFFRAQGSRSQKFFRAPAGVAGDSPYFGPIEEEEEGKYFVDEGSGPPIEEVMPPRTLGKVLPPKQNALTNVRNRLLGLVRNIGSRGEQEGRFGEEHHLLRPSQRPVDARQSRELLRPGGGSKVGSGGETLLRPSSSSSSLSEEDEERSEKGVYYLLVLN